MRRGPRVRAIVTEGEAAEMAYPVYTKKKNKKWVPKSLRDYKEWQYTSSHFHFLVSTISRDKKHKITKRRSSSRCQHRNNGGINECVRIMCQTWKIKYLIVK